jgi:hypothetical protein
MPWNLIIAVVMLIASFAITALTTKSPNARKAAVDYRLHLSAERGGPAAGGHLR